MIDDLTMLANLPVVDADAIAKARAEADKRNRRSPARATQAARVARRGQDPPEQEKGGEEDRG